MNNLDIIDNFFKGTNSNTQKNEFEKKILEDASFADEVAFYISANGLVKDQVKEDKKQRFREMYEQQHKVVSMKQPVRSVWKYLAAASVFVAAILMTWFLSGDKTSAQQLADNYIKQNFQTLSVTMGNGDSLQPALNLFNSGKLTESLATFETFVQNDHGNTTAKKYAGIVSLRLQNYEKALQYFTMLEAETSLYSNPGKFYKAITLLKRNNTGDREEAKILLQEVVAKDLEGKSDAEQWLKKI